MKPFTVKDLTRVLCAVDEDVMFLSLKVRLETCPTTMETIEKWLELLDFLFDLLPMGKLAGKLTKRLIRGIIIIIRDRKKGVGIRRTGPQVVNLVKGGFE